MRIKASVRLGQREAQMDCVQRFPHRLNQLRSVSYSTFLSTKRDFTSVPLTSPQVDLTSIHAFGFLRRHGRSERRLSIRSISTLDVWK